MERDIDRIIATVKAKLPESEFHQLQVTHPGDDDGVWYFYFPGSGSYVQIDAAFGQCPFLVDNSDNTTPLTALDVDSVDGVVDLIVSFLSAKRAALPKS